MSNKYANSIAGMELQNDLDPSKQVKIHSHPLQMRQKRREKYQRNEFLLLSSLCLATMARSSAVLAALLLSLGILVSPQLFLCVATMTHSEGQENFDPSLSTPALTHEYQRTSINS
ncbi:hypothetical protein CFP56_038624 [Quercus suber]|uniref:Uncharacterized protein n=1 Tax=Quercus suber TaxID=58331 RepID=A0AAW0LNW6_QUESU